MTEDVFVSISQKFFVGGWRLAPFIKTSDGYIGVKGWPKRAANNQSELQKLIEERSGGKVNRKMVFGVVPPKGRYIVDIDVKKNSSALQLWREKVVEFYGDISLADPNLVVKTKSGGYHLYYFDGSETPIHSPTAVFGKDSGVDIRGYTGMVIMPSSVGTELDWEPGEYVVTRGDPSQPCTVLQLSKILGDRPDTSVDDFVAHVLYQLNEALRNDMVPELHRYKLIPDSLIIPESNRDNTLYRAARLCRLAGLTQDAAKVFMQYVAARCEVSPTEPLEHWAKLADDKVVRVYADSRETNLTSIAQLFDEMTNAGTVLLRGVAKSYYYFRHGSQLLRIPARSKYATDNLGNVLTGKTIAADDGFIPIRKVISSYEPKEVAYNAAMYPKTDMPFFEYENQTYVNTYHNPFAAFEPNPELLTLAEPYVRNFEEYLEHITGGIATDADHLRRKMAWIVQKPYRRLPTATIVYSHTRGSGKDIFFSLFREVLGRQYYAPISVQTLESPFSSFHDKLLCVASEVQQQANARGTIAASGFMGKIKDLITTKTVSVNEKFQQPYNAPIFTNFVLLSNYELSSLIEPGDRRFDVFHANEEKLDQKKFGALADITNDGIWLDRPAALRDLRKHIIFGIRDYLLNIDIGQDFDRDEALLNEVKQNLIEDQAPAALQWLYHNLPPFFTEEVVIMACHFSPLKTSAEYALKHLKEYFATDISTAYRSGGIVWRMRNAPEIMSRRDMNALAATALNFAGNSQLRRPVYHFKSRIPSNPPGDELLRGMMKRWYDDMNAKLYGPLQRLPGDQSQI
jgi:hypothetical protein